MLPDSVVSRRSQFRERLMELRQPVRQFRERNVPGPDIVGSAEDRITDLRNRIMSRDSVISRIRARRGGGSSDGSGSGSSDSPNVNDSAMT